MTPSVLDQQAITSNPDSSDQSKTGSDFWLVLAALTILYVIGVVVGNRRYIWFDELFTFDIGRSTSFQELWYRVLRFDCNPPTVYLLSGFSMSIFGPTALGLRLPSMVEFYFGSVAILLFVQRKAGIAFAALAVLMLWAASPTLYYAVEARPYALLYCSFAFLLLSWDTAIRTNSRRVALFGVAVSSFALTVTHVFAPFTLFAFVIAEAHRFWRRKATDYALWAALLLPVTASLIYIPLVRLYGGLIFSDDLTRASFRRALSFFYTTLNPPILFLALLAALLIPPSRKATKKIPRFLPEETSLFGCLFLSPILLNLVLMRHHGLFYDRYSITSQAAILVALAILLATRLRLNRFAAYAASLVLVFFIIKIQVFHVLRHPVPKNAAFLASVQPALPIVVGSGTAYMEMNQHESSGLVSRLYFLQDRQASLQFAHTNYFQDFEAPDVMQKAGFPFSGKVSPYSTFIAQHNQFLLLGDTNNPSEWIFTKLRLDRASISSVGEYSGAMPYTDSTLYLVTMP